MSSPYLEPTDVVDAPDLFSSTGTGRATVDERGNSVWEWQTAPGIYSREITPQQFQALQATGLRLVETIENGTLHHLTAHRIYSRISAGSKASPGVDEVHRHREQAQNMLERLLGRASRSV